MDNTFLFYNLLYAARPLLFLIILLIIFRKNVIVRVVLLVLIGVIVFFFRNNLVLDKTSNAILSPSSSLVKKTSIQNNKVYYLTYLSPLDRHFMVAPVDCTVIEIKDMLLEGDAERKTVVCRDVNGDIFELHLIVKKPMEGIGVLGGWVPKVFYKNRIMLFCKVGDRLQKGKRIGLIRFGSNMEYYFPLSYNLHLKVEKHNQVGSVIGFVK